MKDRIDYEKYDIFKGIEGKNLDTLMTCMNAFLHHVGAGEEIGIVAGKTALIVGGTVSFIRNSAGRGVGMKTPDSSGTPDTAEIPAEADAPDTADAPAAAEVIREGDLLGDGFLRSAEVKKVWTEDGCDMLVMNSSTMGMPCWWSCFFHSAFIDNLEKYRAEHS
ncbi:MAG: hypothetical protein LKJ83_02215 [Eubacteriaceae bacterium]|jgi:hypothetical protein|nr:hypothetical protein [Eubacteriaceae bacterium]